MENLIQNSAKLDVLDQVLTMQAESLPEVSAHWSELRVNMQLLGEKLELSQNRLPLDASAIIEDPRIFGE
jgi:hypothetical protein